MNYSKRNKKKKTIGVALSVRCIEVAASHLLLLPSRVVYRPTRFNLTSMFEYSSFFCFIMCWAFPRLICPPTSWFRIGRELCRKWWVRTPAGPTLAIFLFFSLSMRKGCPRCDEGDKLQVLFHGTLLWYITSSILWAHLFLHVNSKNKIINAAVCVPTLNWCLTLKEWSAMRMPHIYTVYSI